MERDNDDTVYCDIQMPVAQGRELLALVNALRESKAHPSLDRVFFNTCRTSSAPQSTSLRIRHRGAHGGRRITEPLVGYPFHSDEQTLSGSMEDSKNVAPAP